MDGTVVFFRNLNLGQGHSPGREQLLTAFAASEASGAWSFQVNGTVVLPRRLDDQDARLLVAEVLGRLAEVCGYSDVAFARPLPWLAGLDLSGLGDGAEVSVFDGPDPFPEALPWVPPRGDLTVVHADERHAVTRNLRPGRSGATPALERRLGVPVTSRGVPTVLRLLAKVG